MRIGFGKCYNPVTMFATMCKFSFILYRAPVLGKVKTRHCLHPIYKLGLKPKLVFSISKCSEVYWPFQKVRRTILHMSFQSACVDKFRLWAEGQLLINLEGLSRLAPQPEKWSGRIHFFVRAKAFGLFLNEHAVMCLCSPCCMSSLYAWDREANYCCNLSVTKFSCVPLPQSSRF